MKSFKEMFGLNEEVSSKVYSLVSKVDAEGSKISARQEKYKDSLMKVDRKGAIGIGKGTEILPDMYEFMNVKDGVASHTGMTILLTPKQVKDTGKTFMKKAGNVKAYEVK
jgi:hypothetical protein